MSVLCVSIMPMIGKTLAHYEITSRLGKGGMGEVYRAKDLKLGRDVAIKVLPEEFAEDGDRVARFQREAKLLASLNHPNIADIHGLEESGGTNFLVLELVEGETLADLLRHGPIRVEESLKLGLQIAEALEAAHEKGVIHRDLKPANIKVTPKGMVKVLDFGLAKTAAGERADQNPSGYTTLSTSATKSGVILGTAAYMSPEQARGESVDERSDIWAFGCVLFEVLTGRRTFEGPTVPDVLASVLKSEPEWNRLPPNLNPRIRILLGRCLEKEAKNRCNEIGEARADIQKTLDDSRGGLAQPIAAVEPRRRLRTILLVIFMTGVAGLAWYLIRSRSNDHRAVFPSEITLGGNLRLLVSSAGGTSDPALSPDGKMLAYVAVAQGRVDLFVSRVAGGERVRLTDDNAEESLPNFSPDGERIVYTRLGSETKKSEIWTIPTLGGQAVRIMDNASDAIWSPDGKQLAFILRRPGEYDALTVSEADGANVSTIFKGDAAYPAFGTLSWSPDGKHLAVSRSSGGITGELWLVPLGGDPPRRLWSDAPGIFSRSPVFTPDGRGLVHESNRAGATNLWVLPLDNRQPIRLTSGPGPDTMPSVARNGSIAFVNSRVHWFLIVQDLASGRIRKILTTLSYYIWAPAFSPSGLELAFGRGEQDGASHIWVASIKGGTPRQLTSGKLPEIYPRFTPDGASIIYNTWSSGPDRIWRVPLSGGPPTALTPARDDDDQFADISPDGQWLAFARTENKVNRIYVAAVNGGEARRLINSASTLPRWSPDGQWIAFSQSRGYIDGIYVIRPDGTGMRRLTEKGGWPVWWPDGKKLGYQNPDKDGSNKLGMVSFEGGPIKTLRPVQFSGTNNPFDISPDGTLLATSSREESSSDIWLLEPKR